MKLILAVTNRGGIAKDGKIPWKIHDETQFFKQMTTSHTVIMGRKTYESIGKPLSNRHNIIVGRNFHTIQQAIKEGLQRERNGESVWVIGGADLAEALQFYITEAFITIVNGEYECDLFVPQYVLDTIDTILRIFKNRKDGSTSDSCAPRIHAVHPEYTVYQCFYSPNYEEIKFQELIQRIVDDGCSIVDRTGVGTISLFGHQLQFSLENGRFPMSTLRPSLKEFLKS